MLFKKYVEVPANTAELTPVWEPLTVMQGTIQQWIIFSDPEAADLLHYKVEYHGSQIMPFRGNKWIEGFLEPITLVENIKIDTPPFVLDFKGYNEDDTFTHEFFVYVNIIQEKAVEPYEMDESLWDKMKGLFGGG